MANIALRNPQFKSVTLGVTENSASCAIKINGTTRYLLTKNRPNTGGFVAGIITLNFDIAELARGLFGNRIPNKLCTPNY